MFPTSVCRPSDIPKPCSLWHCSQFQATAASCKPASKHWPRASWPRCEQPCTALQKPHLSVYHMHFRAVVVVDAGKLEGDVASPDAGQPLGHLWQVKDLIAGDRVLGARDGDFCGTASHCEEDVLGLQAQSRDR